jgi:hypothetical protein
MAGSYNNRAYVSAAPGAFYLIAASDFGVPAPAAPSGTYHAASGSLVTGTTAIEVTWITAEGVSLASTSTLVGMAAAGGVTVLQPALPAKANGTQEVIGWQILSSNSSSAPGAVLLNIGSSDSTPAPAAISTNEGSEIGFLVATTSVLLKLAGAGAAAPSVDNSGIQNGLPSVAANSGAIYYAVVPNSASQWKQQKSVQHMNSDGIAETSGIVLNTIDFIQPVYPGASNAPQGGSNPPVATYTQVSVAPGAFMVLNGYLFEAVQAASASTAATTFIGLSAFNFSKGSSTTDGSVTWLSRGKAGLARFQFSNVTGSAAVPAARAYELFQL